MAPRARAPLRELVTPRQSGASTKPPKLPKMSRSARKALPKPPPPALPAGPLVPVASLAFALAVAASLGVPIVPLLRLVRIVASAVLVLAFFGQCRGRYHVLGWAALVFATSWAATGTGAPRGPAFAVALLVGLFIRNPLAPWVRTRSSAGLSLLVLAALVPWAVAAGVGFGAPEHDSGLTRLDRALYTVAVSWVFMAGLRAFAELLRRWIRRARVRTKLVVAFAIFAITPAVLAFAYAVMASWIHAGSLRASAITRELETGSGGRGVIARALGAPAPRDGAELARRIERERAVLEDRGLIAMGLERTPEGWRAAWASALADSLLAPVAAPVARPLEGDSIPPEARAAGSEVVNRRPAEAAAARPEVMRGLAHRAGRFWWVETALWPRGGDSLALQTFEPVDTTRMNQLARALHCDVVLMSSTSITSEEDSVRVRVGRQSGQTQLRIGGGVIALSTGDPKLKGLTDSTAIDSLQRRGLTVVGGGAYARARSLRDFRGPTNGAATPGCYLWSGSDWRRGTALLLVHSSPGEAFQYSGMDLGPFATVVRVMLIVFAVLFLGLELISLVVGSRVARFITQGAASLRAAAASIGRGDFSARVQVPSEDELGELADSFNRMAAGLEEGQRAMVEREQMRRELELARRIQSRLLPLGPPSLPRLDVAARNAMSQQVGGDYYDFISMEDGRVGFCIADVAGKGVAAALLMSSVKTALVSSAAVESAPDRLTSRVNQLLEQSIEPGRFVTFFLATLDLGTLRLEYVNAGHPAPMLLRAAGGVERLERGGIILGIDAGAAFESGTVTLAPGDLLAMFTDGVTEAQGSGEELFGDERIESVLHLNRDRGAEGVLDALIEAVKGYEGDRGPSDDLTAIIVKVERGEAVR